MLSAVRSRLTYANVMATAAVFIALGGTSIAASSVIIRKSSEVKDGVLTGGDVKNSSLTGKDIKDHSLSPSDFNRSVVGPPGADGPQAHLVPAERRALGRQRSARREWSAGAASGVHHANFPGPTDSSAAPCESGPDVVLRSRQAARRRQLQRVRILRNRVIMPYGSRPLHIPRRPVPRRRTAGKHRRGYDARPTVPFPTPTGAYDVGADSVPLPSGTHTLSLQLRQTSGPITRVTETRHQLSVSGPFVSG